MLAKAPVPGVVKTRLGLPPEDAANLAVAFIQDTWRALGAVPETPRAVAFAGAEAALPPSLASACRWKQCDGDLGARIESVLRRGLEDAARVIAVGSDAPAIPPALLSAGFRALEDHDAVVGPARDGGYVLIGATRCPAGTFDALPWSQPETCAATVTRLRERGFRVAILPTWFDVDQPEDLEDLRAAMGAGWIEAPASERALARLSRC